MAGREKKQLGNKQPLVKRETEKATKGTESQKQDDVNPKTKETKQRTQKDGVKEKRPILTRSTGGVKSKRILPCRDVAVKESEQKTKGKVQNESSKNSQNIKLRQTCKLNKPGISGSKPAEDVSTPSNDLKHSQSLRILRTSKIIKPDVKTEETNLNDISNSTPTVPKIKNTNVGRPCKLNKLGTGNTDVRNGAKGRNMPYVTRSDSPARVLRNGKRRKLKDPSLLEGLDLGYSKRRRLLSTTRDGSGSELGTRSEPTLDDISSIAGSDISFNDSPKVENGKGIWDSDFDSKVPVEDAKYETSSQEAQSSLCSTSSAIQSETTDSCLGKSISNRIAELINRNKFLDSVQKDPVLKQEETCHRLSPSTVDSKEIISKVTGSDKSLKDTNSNSHSKGIPSKIIDAGIAEHHCHHNIAKNIITVENKSLETKEKITPSGTLSKKINSQDLKEFSHKNGQNPLPVIDKHFTEKSLKKVRTFKNKKPRLFQALRSTSGTFYVVQNTTSSPFVKEESKPITPPCAGRLSSDVQVLNIEDKMEQPENNIATSTLNVNIDSVEKKTLGKSQPEMMTCPTVEETSLDRMIRIVNSDANTGISSSTIEDNKNEYVITSSVNLEIVNAVGQIDSKFKSGSNNCDNLIVSNFEGDSVCKMVTDNKNSFISESVSTNEVNNKQSVEERIIGTGSDDSVVDCKEDSTFKLHKDNVRPNSSNTCSLVDDCKYTAKKDCEEKVSECKEDLSECKEELVKYLEECGDLKEESSNHIREMSDCKVESSDKHEMSDREEETGDPKELSYHKELRDFKDESSGHEEDFTNFGESSDCKEKSSDSKEELTNCEDELGDSMTELNDCTKESNMTDLCDDSVANVQCKPDSDFSLFENLTTNTDNKMKSNICPDFRDKEVGENSNSASTATCYKAPNVDIKNSCMSEVGTVKLNENLFMGESLDCSINQPHISAPCFDTPRFETVERVIPDNGVDSSCNSVRRSSRSSLDKTRAALMNCLKSKRTKSSTLRKSQVMDKDESESQSPCMTEDDSTMDSSDLTSMENVKNDDAVPKEAVKVELTNFNSKDNPSEESKDTKIVVHDDLDGDQIEDVPSSRKADITLKEGMEDDPVVKDIGTNTGMESNKTTLESASVALIDIKSLESENTAEGDIFPNNELEGPVIDIDNCAASDITDFTIVDSEKNIDMIDDIALQDAKMEECINSEISNNEDVDGQKAESNISELLSETNTSCVKECEKNTYVVKCKLQNGIEPAFFYSKGNAKDKETRAKFTTKDLNCNSSEIISTSEHTETLSENQDLKTDCLENKSEIVLLQNDKREVISDDVICSGDVEMLANVGNAFSPEVFQGDVDVNEECELIPSLTLDYRNNELAQNVKDLEVGELRCEELNSTLGGNEVENDIEEKSSQSISNVTDAQRATVEEGVSPEELAIKESVLSALGLQPLRSSSQAGTSVSCNSKTTDSSYTGTLKTVIKLQRSSEKRRSSLKLVLKNGKAQSSIDDDDDDKDDENDEFESDDDGEEVIKYKICKETESSESSKDPFAYGIGSSKSPKQSYSYRNFDITNNSPQLIAEKSSANEQQASDLNCQDDKTSSTKQSTSLVIPEKSSSFSIHPGRLCSDVCSYCFGKFGSLDTPCHVAQLKSLDRQQKILEAETHLTADSCLCDACYRHVDRKANCPSYKPNKKRQHHRNSTAQIKTMCCVQGCTQTAHHQVRRKWLIKLKRSITKKVPIDMDKMPQLLLFPLCSKHYSWVDFFMVCGICKRRLTRNHMYPLGPEVHELNTALASDGIPVRLSDKLFLCKLCRYFASVRLKYKDPSQLAGNHKLFFQGYRKRILHFHDIEEPDEETAEEEPPKPKRRKTKNTSSTALKMDGEDDSGTKNKCEQVAQSEDQHSADAQSPTIDIVNLGDSVVDRSGASTPMIDYSTLGSGTSHTNVNIIEDNPSHKQGLKVEHLKPPKIRVKLSNVNTGKNGHLSSSPEDRPMSRSILLPERDGLEVTPVPDSINSPFYPGEEQLPLHADFDFHENKNETADKRRDWEKCTASIQFDKDTKSLFQHLQRPYGNHSSFFRHLILLEKYWRSGELILSPCANSRATTYINSVQNRIHAYEGRPSFSHYGATLTSTKSITTSAASLATPVPVIDLPLKRRLGGGILTASDGSSKPVTITSVSSVSISPQPVSFTPISAVGTSVLSPCHSRMPLYTSFQSNPPTVSRKVLIDAITSTGSHFQPNRRIPNVLQVTTAGKSFSILPNVSQIREIHSIQQQPYQKQHIQQQQPPTFEPMICDVRSLATENGSNLWERNIPHTSSRSHLHQQSNVSVALLPKTSTIQSSGITIKPSTIVTPTGIILSRKPEISVTAITDKRDISLKPKAVSGRKEIIVSKVKTVTDKLDIAKAKAVLEKKDIIVHATVPEVKDSMSNTKC